MKGSALLFMLFSWGLVLSLSTYCFSKLFAAETQCKSKKRKRTKKAGKETKKKVQKAE